MSKNKGLGSGIGTFTHTAYLPYVQQAISEGSKISTIRKKIGQIEELISERQKELYGMMPVEIRARYCTLCGAQHEYQGQSPIIWRSTKRCDKCKTSSMKRTRKFCRSCGKEFTFASLRQKIEARWVALSQPTPVSDMPESLESDLISLYEISRGADPLNRFCRYILERKLQTNLSLIAPTETYKDLLIVISGYQSSEEFIRVCNNAWKRNGVAEWRTDRATLEKHIRGAWSATTTCGRCNMPGQSKSYQRFSAICKEDQVLLNLKDSLKRLKRKLRISIKVYNSS